MSGASLIVCLALTAAAPGPGDLIAGLGSARYADREAAASALERLGRSALPALRASRDHPDLEVRTRVAALLEKIEGALLLEPTPVVLDFQDRPIAEVLGEINARTGLQIALAPDPAPKGLASRRVTLRSERPLPFWAAIDRLCDAGGLQYGFPGQAGPTSRDRSFTLAAGGNRPPGLMSDHGPFRVNLMSLHYQRDLTFGGGGTAMAPRPVGPQGASTTGGQAVNEQFTARLQAAAEPHLSLRQAGPLKLATAVDELGQSLLQPSTAASPFYQPSTYYGMTPGTVPFQAFLKRPDRPGRTIKLLRGSLPITIMTRKPGPLVVPLEGATNRTFRNEEVGVVVHEAKPGPNSNGVSVEVSITPQSSRAPVVGEVDVFQPRSDMGSLQIELVDAAGRPLGWYPSSTQQNGDEFRMTLTIVPGPNGAAAPAASLRYYATSRTNAELPFEFRDVPMP